MAKKLIVISGGATREAIDSVRFLSNISSGETAFRMAKSLSCDFEVFLLMGENFTGEANQKFSSARDLEAKLKHLCLDLKPWALLHAAAVSDYFVSEVDVNGEIYRGEDLSRLQKIPSSNEIKLKLSRNKKIVNEIKSWSSSTKLVAFKLTDTQEVSARQEAVKKIFLESRADAVIHNDLSELSNKEKRKFSFFRTPEEFKNMADLNSLIHELRGFLS